MRRGCAWNEGNSNRDARRFLGVRQAGRVIILSQSEVTTKGACDDLSRPVEHSELARARLFRRRQPGQRTELPRRCQRAIRGRIDMGRFHERPVGPHPCWSYQIAFIPAQFAAVVGWLALNHGKLDVFVHPNTDDELRDHRDCAMWLGRSWQLDLRAVGG